MSWDSAAWDWYAVHSDRVNPIVGFVGGAALIWAAIQQARTATNRHYEQTRADLQRRLTETFSKAVEQLANDKIEVRLGGIYTLERLAIEAIAQARQWPRWRRFLRLLRRRDPHAADPVSDLYWTVMETLTAFVRERARWEEPPKVTPFSEEAVAQLQETLQPRPSTDIAAVLKVIGRRPDRGREREQQRDWRLDLRASDLRGAHFEGHFERTVLQEAHLERAFLRQAHLEDAFLLQAHLEHAFFSEVHLERAVLIGAHLRDAVLNGAHLEGAWLNGAHLERADLRGAHLEGAILFGAVFDGAIGDDKTLWPVGFPRPNDWPPYEPGEVPSQPSTPVSLAAIGGKFVAKLRALSR